MNQLSPDPAEFATDPDDSPAPVAESEIVEAPIRIHGNSGPMRAVKTLRADLLRHLGNKPSPVQLAMIDQAAEIKLRLAVMDQTFRRTGRRSAHATRDYLAWSNSFTRLLRQFGLNAPVERGPTLAEVLASAPPPRARPALAVAPASQAPSTPQPVNAPSEAAA